MKSNESSSFEAGGAAGPFSHSRPNSFRVPGARAGVYVGRRLFQSLLRHLLSSQSGLGRFARSLFSLSRKPRNGSTGTVSAGLPMPLPFPEVCRHGSEDFGRDAALKCGVNGIVLVLNFLHLGQPSIAPSNLRLGQTLTSRQWKSVALLKSFLLSWVDSDDVDPISMGRSAAKIESIEDAVLKLETNAKTFAAAFQSGYLHGKDEVPAFDCPSDDPGVVVGTSSSSSFSTYKEIDPDRLQFVGFPVFDPRPYLDKRGCEIFEHPMLHSLDPDSFEGDIPFVKMHCDRDAKLKLFELLDRSNRLSLHTAGNVRTKFSSGMFSVLKSLDKDRLIMDSRPPNCLEVPLQRWIRSLGSAESLVQLTLESDEVLLCSGNDIRDYYHMFSVSEERCRRNILTGPVSPADVRHLQCFKSEFEEAEALWGGLATLAMGDAQAVELAQTCHVGLTLSAGVTDGTNLLNLSGFHPRCRDVVGVIIDDFISISAVKKSGTGPSQSSRYADLMDEKYAEVGLISHKEKGFRDSLQSTFWGVDLDGEVGSVRGSLKRAIPLFGLLIRVAKLGYASVGLLQILSGSVVALFLFRRRFLSVMHYVFQACRGRSEKDIVKLSGRLKGELLTLACLLPVAVTNLRATIQDRIVATDASNHYEAAVVARAPIGVCRELHRFSLRKPVWTRLLPPGKAWERAHTLLDPCDELPEGVEPYKTNPLWETAAECLDYEVFSCRAVTSPRHINVGEVRALLVAERKLGRQQLSCRDVFGLDSQVALGCLVKGRSSSVAINRELSKSVGDMVVFDHYSSYMYYETQKNPADDPTRSVSLRKRRMDPPSWWKDLSEGKVEPFDAWAAQMRLDFATITGLPAFDELTGGGTLNSGCVRKDPAAPLRSGGFSDSGDDIFPSEFREETTTSSTAKCSSGHSTLLDKASLGSAAEDPVPRECLVPEVNVTSASCPAGQKEEETLFISTDGPLAADVSKKVFEIFSRFRRSQVYIRDSDTWPPRNAGFLDLYSGECGVACQLHSLTGAWVLCFDIVFGFEQDLGCESLRGDLLYLLGQHCFHGFGAAPVCRSFSVAVTPPIRTLAFPYGISDVSEAVKERLLDGNSTAKWLIKMVVCAMKVGAHFWIENPAMSWLFRLPEFLHLLEHFSGQIGFWIADYCRFGRRWRKRTKFLTSCGIKGYKTLCKGCKEHIKLRGRSQYHRKSWTLVAQPYPKGVCKVIAMSLAGSCNFFGEDFHFDPSSCARCLNPRIGEASNPGPVVRGNFLLEDVPLVEAKTSALQAKVWGRFERWLSSSLSGSAKEAVLSNPVLLCSAVKEYGNVLYSEGAALYVYRHLAVYVQKTIFGVRPYMNVVWDNLHRWESLAPVTHRVPIPGSVLRAVVALALCWSWPRFAATLCLSFFGITRPGEVLKARRRDLLLPRDLLCEAASPAYLRIVESKSRRHGKRRIQHASVLNLQIVSFLDKVFSSLGKEDLLYPISGSSFRRRWDKLCQHLLIGPEHKLTPGSLRGGGALEEYRAGTDLQRILWRMRIRHLITLEHYVQEVAAESFLVDVSEEGRRRISLLSELFSPAVSSFSRTS